MTPFNPKFMNWRFDKTDPSLNQSSGDVGKIVRNWTQKAPGVFGLDMPGHNAVLLAREGLQNSWDSADDRRRDDPTAPSFKATFRFLSLTGKEKKAFVEATKLKILADRAEKLDPSKTVIQDPEVFATLDDPNQPLKIMQLIETGTTGMSGPWEGSKSRMFLAMKSVSFTAKRSGLGGSYGLGKAGLIRASGIRAVFGYTAFQPDKQSSEDVTRRFLGMTYWSQHELEGTDYTGWVSFADPDNEGRPLNDESADRMAEKLNIEVRDPQRADEIGSTFLVVDPTVKPIELARAIERNWWPALVDQNTQFDVTVCDYDGNEIAIRPKNNTHLAPFISAYEHLTAGNKTDQEFRVSHLQGKSVDTTNLGPGEGQINEPGGICITWDMEPGSWTFPTPNDPTREHRSLVALIRKPRMVVEYLEHGSRDQPYVRGVFLAHDANDLLAATEPPLHDDWEDRGDEPDVPPGARELARYVKERIRGLIGDARNPLKPKVPEVERSSLSVISALMRKFLGGQGRGNPPSPPPPPPRAIGITFEKRPSVAVAGGDLIKSQTTLAFTPMSEVKGEAPFLVHIEVSYRLFEAGAPGTRWEINLLSKLPNGFVEVEHKDRLVLEGQLPADGINIAVESEPHQADWTGEFLPVAVRVDNENGDE